MEQNKIPWQRPEDYFAEMVKSDGHMAKVKDQLMFEQKRITLAEERRKARESKKHAKQVQAIKLQEKQKTKKQKSKQIQSLRNQRKRMGFGEEFDWDMAVAEIDAPKDKSQRRVSSTPVKSKKRMYKDAKFGRSGGFGPARQRKRNTAESSSDMSRFPSKTNRPGKSRRMAKISKRRSRM